MGLVEDNAPPVDAEQPALGSGAARHALARLGVVLLAHELRTQRVVAHDHHAELGHGRCTLSEDAPAPFVLAVVEETRHRALLYVLADLWCKEGWGTM
eukprot:3937533-Rhodomonas_salina.1